jgi:hypothetical protein
MHSGARRVHSCVAAKHSPISSRALAVPEGRACSLQRAAHRVGRPRRQRLRRRDLPQYARVRAAQRLQVHGQPLLHAGRARAVQQARLQREQQRGLYAPRRYPSAGRPCSLGPAGCRDGAGMRHRCKAPTRMPQPCRAKGATIHAETLGPDPHVRLLGNTHCMPSNCDESDRDHQPTMTAPATGALPVAPSVRTCSSSGTAAAHCPRPKAWSRGARAHPGRPGGRRARLLLQRHRLPGLLRERGPGDRHERGLPAHARRARVAGEAQRVRGLRAPGRSVSSL